MTLFSPPTSSLNYLNARFYDSARGQFTSQDPMFLIDPKMQNLQDPQSLNSYSYASNNPIIKSDPSGKCTEPFSFFFCVLAAYSYSKAANNAVSTYLMHKTPYAFSEEQLEKADNQLVFDSLLTISGLGLPKNAAQGLDLLTTGMDVMGELSSDSKDNKNESNRKKTEESSLPEIKIGPTQGSGGTVYNSGSQQNASYPSYAQSYNQTSQSSGSYNIQANLQQIIGLYTKVINLYQQLIEQESNQQSTNTKK